MAQGKLWMAIAKKLFSGNIKQIEKNLQNNPEILNKTKELQKGLEELKKLTDAFEEKYG